MDEEYIIKVVNFVQKRPIFAVFRPDLTEKESFYILDDVFNGAVFFSSISPAENRFSSFYLGPSHLSRLFCNVPVHCEGNRGKNIEFTLA